jgi:hypothetical protein
VRSIRIRAEGPGGVGPYVDAAGSVQATVGLPVAGAVMYLDSRGLSATSKLTQWTDLSGSGNHFAQSNTGYQPSVTAPKTGEPFPAVVFTGGQYLQSTVSAFDIDLNNAARRAMTVFTIYKPSSATANSAITGKGAAWCVCGRAAGATGAAGGRMAHACRSTTRAQVLPRRRLGHVLAGAEPVER